MTNQANTQSPPPVYEMKNWVKDQLHQQLSELVKNLVKHDIDLKFAKKELEILYIQEVLSNNQGNIGLSAKELGIHRNTLSKRIKDLKVH